jgi:uncharacterized protein YjcR
MENNPLKVTLDEITTEKIIEIESYLQNERFVDLITTNLISLGDYRKIIREHAKNIEQSCRVRAIRAYKAGVPIKEVSKALGFSQTIIKRWSNGSSDV